MGWRLQTVLKERTAAARTFWRRRSTHNGVQTNQWAVNVGVGVFTQLRCISQWCIFKTYLDVDTHTNTHRQTQTHTHAGNIHRGTCIERVDGGTLFVCLALLTLARRLWGEKTLRRPLDGGPITMVLFDAMHWRVTEEGQGSDYAHK